MNNKCLIVSIIALLLLNLIGHSVAIVTIGKFSTSSSQGSNLYVGGSGPNNYTKIQYAIDAAFDGDTIFVYDDSSPYYENLMVNKTLNFIGENKKTTIIDGYKIGDGFFIIADRVNVTGFTIRNSGGIIPVGIYSRSDGNTFVGNIIKNNGDGIWLYKSKGNIVKNNVLTDHKYGVNVYDSHDNIIGNNTIQNGSFGVYLFIGAHKNYVSNNVISNYRDGILIEGEGSSDHIILNNNIENCTCGISANSIHNQISNNQIINSTCGIYVQRFTQSYITSNHVINCDQGLYITSSSSNNVISNNTINNNMKGIYLWYSSNDNKIEYNTFQNNFRNVYFQDSSNLWNHNYWGRPKVLFKIILGGMTIPPKGGYVLPWLEFDWNPSKQPIDNKLIGG